MLSFVFFASKPLQTVEAKGISLCCLCNSSNFSSCSGNQRLLSLSQGDLPLSSSQDVVLSIKIDI